MIVSKNQNKTFSNNCLYINGIGGSGVTTFSSILRDFFCVKLKETLTKTDYNSNATITLVFDSQHPACLEDLRLVNKTKKLLLNFKRNVAVVALINRMDCGTESYKTMSKVVRKEYEKLFNDNKFNVDYLLSFSCVYAKYLLNFYEKSISIPNFFKRKIYYEYANKYIDDNKKIDDLLRQKITDILKFYNITKIKKIYEK